MPEHAIGFDRSTPILENGLSAKQGRFGEAMAYAGNGKHRVAGERRLYTLTEVAESIQISMPTAQRYKKIYQSRIPAVGVGRKQRYPKEALKVFEQIKLENLDRRGRPPRDSQTDKTKVRARSSPRRRTSRNRTTGRRPPRARSSSAAARPASSKSQTRPPKLLTLTEISYRTGISYPTCINYVKKHSDRIPHVGSGRNRRFPPQAVKVFRELRMQSRRGKRKQSSKGPSRTEAALLTRIRELEKSQRQLSRRLDAVIKTLRSPLRITIKRG